MVMFNFSFKTIWHITNKQARVVQLFVVQAVEEWMVIVQQSIIMAHVHIQRMTMTKPGGEWTWGMRSVLLKCTLSTETMETDWTIFRSELVGYCLPFTFKCTKTTTLLVKYA